ncbi:MAG: DUF1295 domain-containing protein [Candidatus Omnitrophota bacterium]
MLELKSSRKTGFIVIAFGYAVAAAAGFSTFALLDGVLWLRILSADLAATAVVYIFSLIFDNASFYDPYWSVQPLVILPSVAFSLHHYSSGVVILLVCIACWAVRLTANWAYTFHGLDQQDWRYDMLQKKSGRLFPLINLVGIQIFPTIIVFLCILPAIKFIELDCAWNAITFAGAGICLAAVILQLVSDMQMQQFRKGDNKSRFIRSGLWRYSRHPNYLGEILMWWGVYLMLLSADPAFWRFGCGALANTLMFLFISIPMVETRLAGYKPGFSEYRRQTRMLFPIKK